MSLSSAYPPPPSLYKHFTNENLSKLKNGDDKSYPLNLLIPPPPPSNAPYRSFGDIWQPDDKLLPLTEVGIAQLYKAIQSSDELGRDRIWELKKLLKSLLSNFLELVGILSVNPQLFPAKVEDIRVILINMHHLLNEYRPHQARESLIMLMEDQINKKKQNIENIRKSNHEIQAKIAEMADNFKDLLPQDIDQHVDDQVGTISEEPEDVKEKEKEKDLRIWNQLVQKGILN